MEKTIEQWLNDLPEPYRSQALENHANQKDEDFVKWFNKKQTSPSEAVYGGFDWEKTTQGHQYWEDFHNLLLDLECLNPGTAVDKMIDEVQQLRRERDRAIELLSSAMGYIPPAEEYGFKDEHGIRRDIQSFLNSVKK